MLLVGVDTSRDIRPLDMSLIASAAPIVPEPTALASDSAPGAPTVSAITSVAVEVAPAAASVPAAASTRALYPASSAVPPRIRADGPPQPVIAAGALLLLDDASGAVLVHDGGHTPLPPASLTKIATAVLAIETLDLDATVTVDVDSRTMRGSTVMGLVPGDTFTVRDLLYGLMLPSGNDAAIALGRQVSAGSDADFVERMNALAGRLGLTETHFANPHGLNAAGHLTSAYDLAILTRYAMTLPAFREIAGTQFWEAAGSRSVPLWNVAGGSLRTVPGADAVKSGFTRQAGRTLVLTATRDGHRLYAVVLNDPQRETDAARLLGWAFSAFEWGAEPAVASVPTTPTGG